MCGEVRRREGIDDERGVMMRGGREGDDERMII